MQGDILSFREEAWRNDGAEAALCRDERISLLIGAPDGQAADMLRPLAEALGNRVLDALPLDALPAHLGDVIALDTLLVDLRGLPVDDDGFTAAARADRERLTLGGCALIVLFDIAAIDRVVAELDGPDCILLCAPSRAEIVAALAMAGVQATGPGSARRGRTGIFQDVAREGDAARIDLLSEEVRRLAETIERLAAADHGFGHGLGEETGTRDAERMDGRLGDRRRTYRDLRPIESLSQDVAAPSHAEVRALIRARRLRDRFLPASLFADPAWDMMLDLLAARLSGKRVSVSSLCIAAAVPPTTALRWIRQLTDRGIVARIDDPVDGRRVFIELTDEAAAGMISWARAVRGQGGLLAAR